MHDPEDDGGHDEGVGETGGGVGELVSELDVVVVEPASGNYGDAIEAGDRGLGKETGEDLGDVDREYSDRNIWRGIC